jgi:hypothetical protein
MKNKKPLSFLKGFLKEYGSYLLSRPAIAGCSTIGHEGLIHRGGSVWEKMKINIL